MLFLKCLKENLIDTTGSDWAFLLIFHSFFFFFFLAAQFKVKKKKSVWKKEREKKILHYRKLIHQTTPLFFSDKTSVAKGQGDLHGEAYKEKDTGWEWKNIRTTPLSFQKSIDYHKKDGMQFLSGEYSQTI